MRWVVRSAVLAVAVLLLSPPSAFGKPKLGNGFACKWGSDCESGECSLSSRTCTGKGSGASSKRAAGAPCKWGSDCASGKCSMLEHACEGGAPASRGGSSRRSGGDGDAPAARAADVPEPLPAPTACSRDLMATVYKDHAGSEAYERYAHQYCDSASDADRETAKQLWLAGYGSNFGRVISAIKGATPKQIECAKAEIDRMGPAAKNSRDFEIAGLCNQAPAIVHCEAEVRAAVYPTEQPNPHRKSQAQIVCEEFKPDVIAQGVVLFKAGYGKDFRNILRLVTDAKPGQIECAKQQFDLMAPEKKATGALKLDRICASPGPQTECFFDLMNNVYTDRNTFYGGRDDTARADCADYSAEHITLAKKFRAAGYTAGFSDLLRHVKKETPAQVKCRLGHIAKANANEKKDPSFLLPASCK